MFRRRNSTSWEVAFFLPIHRAESIRTSLTMWIPSSSKWLSQNFTRSPIQLRRRSRHRRKLNRNHWREMPEEVWRLLRDSSSKINSKKRWKTKVTRKPNEWRQSCKLKACSSPTACAVKWWTCRSTSKGRRLTTWKLASSKLAKTWICHSQLIVLYTMAKTI